MGIEKIPAGRVQIDATLTKGTTLQSKGGGYSFTIQTTDEAAVALFGKNNNPAVVTLDFYTPKVTVDEDPAQMTFDQQERRTIDVDEKGEETGSSTK